MSVPIKEQRRSDAAASAVDAAPEAAVPLFPPLWPDIPGQTATGGQPFWFQVPPAVVPGGGTVSYGVAGTSPAWLSFDAGSLTLSGTPPRGLVSDTITLRAFTVGTALYADATVQVTVGNSAPDWATLPDRTVASHTANFSLTLPPATDNESTAAQLVYFINPALLPPGLHFDAPSRTISGMPTTPGSYHITARVTDAETPPLFTERSFVLQVTNDGPSWNVAVPTQTAVRTRPFSFMVPAAVDPEGLALTYRMVSGPAWLSVDATSHVVSGTPPLSAASLGMQAVVLEAQDPPGAAVRLSFSVNVVNLPPTWGESPALPGYAVPAGSLVDYTPPAALDPYGEPLTYRVVSGSLPPGVTLNASSGRLSGPTSANHIANHAVVLRATDPQGAFVDRSLAMALLNSPPVYAGGLKDNYPGYQSNPITVLIPHSAFSDVNGAVSLSVEGATPGLLPYTGATIPWVPGTYFEPMYWGPRPVHGSADQPADPGSRPIGVFTFYSPSAAPGTVLPVKVRATDANGAMVSRTFTVTVMALPSPPPSPPPPPPGPRPPRPPGGPPRSEP